MSRLQLSGSLNWVELERCANANHLLELTVTFTKDEVRQWNRKEEVEELAEALLPRLQPVGRNVGHLELVNFPLVPDCLQELGSDFPGLSSLSITME